MSSGSQTAIRHELESARRLLETFISDDRNIQHIEAAALMMAAAIGAGGKIMSCGNGGSHCDAMHFAEELTGRYRLSRRPIAAMAISDPSHMSCVGNDFGFDHVFSRYIEALGKPGDVLLAISSSGNAANIIQAVAAARERDMRIVLLLGNEGGSLRGRGDIEIVVPYVGFADRIQEIHIKVIHTVIHCLETLLEGKYGF